MIKAIQEKANIGSRGQNFTLRVDRPCVEYTGVAPSHGLCRELIKLDPMYSDFELMVFDRNGRELYKISNIGKWAKKNLVENENGIKLVNYVPMPDKLKGVRESI